MKTLKDLQELPWLSEYSLGYRKDPRPHKHVAHALLHIAKAVGRLFALCDALDHGLQAKETRAKHAAYLADIVISAARIAEQYPGGAINLQAAVDARVAEKFT